MSGKERNKNKGRKRKAGSRPVGKAAVDAKGCDVNRISFKFVEGADKPIQQGLALDQEDGRREPGSGHGGLQDQVAAEAPGFGRGTGLSAAQELSEYLGDRKFSTILADPPWRFAIRTGKVAPEHRRLSRYETLSFDEIGALPVSAHVTEAAHCYLWVPNARNLRMSGGQDGISRISQPWSDRSSA